MNTTQPRISKKDFLDNYVIFFGWFLLILTVIRMVPFVLGIINNTILLKNTSFAITSYFILTNVTVILLAVGTIIDLKWAKTGLVLILVWLILTDILILILLNIFPISELERMLSTYGIKGFRLIKNNYTDLLKISFDVSTTAIFAYSNFRSKQGVGKIRL